MSVFSLAGCTDQRDLPIFVGGTLSSQKPAQVLVQPPIGNLFRSRQLRPQPPSIPYPRLSRRLLGEPQPGSYSANSINAAATLGVEAVPSENSVGCSCSSPPSQQQLQQQLSWYTTVIFSSPGRTCCAEADIGNVNDARAHRHKRNRVPGVRRLNELPVWIRARGP